MYVLSSFNGKFPMVTCNHYEHVHVLKAKTFQMIFRQLFNLVTIYFNGHSSYSTLTLFLFAKIAKILRNYFTNFLSFTETEGLQKLFYFKESENECAKERLKVNNI